MDIVVIVCVSLAVGLAVGFGKTRFGTESVVKGVKAHVAGAPAKETAKRA